MGCVGALRAAYSCRPHTLVSQHVFRYPWGHRGKTSDNIDDPPPSKLIPQANNIKISLPPLVSADHPIKHSTAKEVCSEATYADGQGQWILARGCACSLVHHAATHLLKLCRRFSALSRSAQSGGWLLALEQLVLNCDGATPRYK